MIVIRILLSPLRLMLWAYCRVRNLRREKTLVIHQIPDRFSHLRATGWLSRFLPRPDVHFVEYLALLDILAKSGLKTIILRVPDIEASWAEAEAVVMRLDALAKAGKKLIAISEGGNLKTLFLMTAAEERYTSLDASFLSVFPSAEPVFVRNALARFGIKVESFTAGKYKSAAEMFTRDSMSLPARQNLESVLKDMRREIVQRFEQTGARTTSSLLLDNVLIHAADLKKTGFIRQEISALFPLEHLAGVPIGMGSAHAYASADSPADDLIQDNSAAERLTLLRKEVTTEDAVAGRFHRSKFQAVRLRRLPSAAFLALEGPITMGRPGDEPQTMGINALAFRDIIQAIEDGPDEAAFFFINSPGGSADASEILYQAMKKLGRVKPIIAIVGPVAASGGYYLASAAHRIHAPKMCLTGSIGVIAVRPNLKGLYKLTRVKKERVLFDKTRDILSASAELSGSSRKLLMKHIADTYRVFIDRVSSGRGIPPGDTAKSAGGQIFTGSQFLRLGFLDGHLDFLGALSEYRQKAGYRLDQEFQVSFYPELKADVRSIVSSRLPIPGIEGKTARVLAAALDQAFPYSEAFAFLLRAKGAPALFSPLSIVVRA